MQGSNGNKKLGIRSGALLSLAKDFWHYTQMAEQCYSVQHALATHQPMFGWDKGHVHALRCLWTSS